MQFAETIEFNRLMEPVALRLFGPPREKHRGGKEWRYRNHGSLSIDTEKGTYFDHEANQGGGVFDLIRRQGYDQPASWLRREGLITATAPATSRIEPKIIAETYDYHYENGKLGFQVVRYNPKGFSQRRPDGNGGWINKLDDTLRVPYRLPELIKAVADGKTIYIPEGERDVDNLYAAGMNATTNPGGVRKWRAEYNQYLRGADVVILPDNDDEGRAHAAQIAESLAGVAKTARILDIAKHWPECPVKGDVSDWLCVGGGSAEKLAHALAANGERPLPWINMSSWEDGPPPPREWAVEDRIPLRQPYLFTGHGAVGKSLVELQRACAHVLDRYWLGMKVRQGQVIYFGAEDDQDEIRRRLTDILAHYDAKFADVIGKLHLLSYAGDDCLLGEPDTRGIIRPTGLWAQVEQAVMDIRPVAVMFDTLTDVYAGDEISRTQTTQFLKMAQKLAVRASCSMGVLAHPSNAGMSSGSGLSGSTGWHNKVRARSYMRALETPKGDEPDPDAKEIQFLKNNYGKFGDTIRLRWQHGVYVLESAPNSLEKLASDQSDEDRFIELLGQFEASGRKVSDTKSANNYAPRAFSEEKNGTGRRVPATRFEQAMKRLFTARKIHIHEYGRPSRPSRCLALGPKPE
jgi:RecA-family ATPase